MRYLFVDWRYLAKKDFEQTMSTTIRKFNTALYINDPMNPSNNSHNAVRVQLKRNQNCFLLRWIVDELKLKSLNYKWRSDSGAVCSPKGCNSPPLKRIKRTCHTTSLTVVLPSLVLQNGASLCQCPDVTSDGDSKKRQNSFWKRTHSPNRKKERESGTLITEWLATLHYEAKLSAKKKCRLLLL